MKEIYNLAQARTEVWQHGGFQMVSTCGRGVMKLQQSFQALLLGRSLNGCAQADGDRRHHGTQSLDQQHCHYFIRVSEHLQGFQTKGYSCFSSHTKEITPGGTVAFSPACTTGAERATWRARFRKTQTAVDSDWARSGTDPAKRSPTDPKEARRAPTGLYTGKGNKGINPKA